MKQYIKSINQMEAYRSIRKAGLPQNKMERPTKGGGYRRREKFQKDWSDE